MRVGSQAASRGVMWLFLWGIGGVLPAFGAEDPQRPADSSSLAAKARPLLDRYCRSCHQGEKPAGKFDLASLPPEVDSEAGRRRWLALARRIDAGEMPPADQPRPSADELREFSKWIRERVAAAEAVVRDTQGRAALRRLNRVEYENTINDLLCVRVRLQDQLPADGAANGFDNAGAALHTSSFLLEKYLEAAEVALDAAIVNRPQAPPSTTKRYYLKAQHPVRSTTEDVYRFRDEGEVVCFCSSEWHSVWISEFYPQVAGNYRFRISASGIQRADQPLTFRVTITGSALTGKNGLVGYFDAPPDKPRVFEFERIMAPRTTISILPYGLAHANTVKQQGGEKWTGPGLAVQYVEIEGPCHDTWPPASHRQLFGELAWKNVPHENARDRVEVASDAPRADAERVLLRFARRAFRRTVSAADVAPFVEITLAKMERGYTFELALRAALKGILISPEFLFLRERPGLLDDFALASRLSYFLWSTMPDEILLDLAEQRQLSRPEVLREQVERLLRDPKAEQFTTNFVGQWLGLREIDATEPSHLLYPEFDHLLKVSMIRETELFFEELLGHDLSVSHFVDSDFCLLNGRLAKHYGIPGVSGYEFRKTAIPPESHRGGVLTMASVLKVTANGTSTSPVTRGAWVLDRILGTPPPPPPDNISAIDPDIRGATTIREQLAKHRSIESCGVCHRQIDPPGFALENFDCIGGWRDWYRVTGNGGEVVVEGRRMPYHKGKPVDASAELTDGERFENVDQFKKLLARDPRRIARTVATKLLTYATGQAPSESERAAVDVIVDRAQNQNYGLRTLVHEVVRSDLFQRK